MSEISVFRPCAGSSRAGSSRAGSSRSGSSRSGSSFAGLSFGALSFAALSLALLAVTAACENNIGRAFDRDGGGGGGDDGSDVRAVPVGGFVVEGRPRVVATFPTGNGWPTSVPIVVVFNESMNLDSIVPEQGREGATNLFLRLQNTEPLLPTAYDFLLGDTVVVMRPPTGLQRDATYEIVATPELRDVDGTRLGGAENRVLASFTVNEAEDFDDGKVVTTLPLDGARDVIRETPLYAVFTKPVNPATVTATSFTVREPDGRLVVGEFSFPINPGPNADARIVRFDPTQPLLGPARIEVGFDDTIAFPPSGVLDFENRSPFAEFDTLPHEQPLGVTVGNATSGFPDKVNRGNLQSLQLDVSLGASAAAGDTIVARIYGLDPTTTAQSDVDFVERRAPVPIAGAQTVSVDFGTVLGTLEEPRFGEGNLTLTAQLLRGRRASAFIHHGSARSPRLDVTLPTIAELGPPAGPGENQIVFDQDRFVLYGTASEALGGGVVAVGSATANLYASRSDGFFVFAPIATGRVTAPVSFSVSLTDGAGNLAATAFSGQAIQRGVVTGASSGRLVVEVYDEVTFEPLAGVTVIVEPGLPTKPPASTRRIATTANNGRAVFSGLPSGSRAVTLVRDDYDLFTLLSVTASFASLPLRPAQGATATLVGTLNFVPTPDQTALVGCNLIDDRGIEDVQTFEGTPTVLEPVAIRPNRLAVVNAFSGVFEPTALTTFAGVACGMCGTDGRTPTVPFAPTPAGEQRSVSLVFLPSQGVSLNLAAPFLDDFSTSLGLGSISGTPRVRIVGNLRGIPGQTLFGVGFASASGANVYSIHGSYALTAFLNVLGFEPSLWVSTEARDTAGNIVRHRVLIPDPNLGTTFSAGIVPPSVPTIAAPSGPITGSPAVTYADRVDGASLPAGLLAFTEFLATDPDGRSWRVLVPDGDGRSAADTVQFPVLTGTGASGLATGTWRIGADDHLVFASSMTTGDYMLEERLRQPITFARAKRESFTIR